MKQRASHVTCMVLALALVITLVPSYAFAASVSSAEIPADTETSAVLRVAFPESEGISMVDDNGVPSGVFYDWLIEIAKYTGWKYEFVDGDIDELIESAMRGEIDLVGGMYYREILDTTLDFSSFSIGSNRSALICADDNDGLVSFDIRTLNGKTIGAYKNAQEKVRRLQSFLDFNGLDSKVALLDYESYETCLEDGTADLMLGSRTTIPDGCKMVAEFDGEPYYITMAQGDPRLTQLNEAMTQIYAADPEFADELYSTYYPSGHHGAIEFSEDDQVYLEQAGVIRVAVVEDRYPLYYMRDGDHKGVVLDIFGLITERTGLSFRFMHSDTYQGALDLVAHGEADVMGCFMDDEYAAAQRGFAITRSYAALNEVTLRNKQYEYSSDHLIFAQITGLDDPGFDEASKTVYYATYKECLEAVNLGQADFTSMPSSYAENLFMERAYNNIAPTASSHGETTFSIAFPEPVDSSLYSVMSKAVSSLSDSEIKAITSRSAMPISGHQMTLESFVSENPLLVVLLCLVLFVLVGVIGLVVSMAKVRNRMMEMRLEKAEEMGQAKMDFLSRMSHEIRTPMNAIIGLANVASLSGEATPAIRTNLDKINTSAQFLLSLVNDILDMSKIGSGKMHIETAPFPLYSLAERLQSMFCVQAEEKSVTLRVDCDVDAVVVADDVRLQQVLANLASNAFKFTDRGGIIDVGIKEVAHLGGQITVRFGVKDNGTGIPEEDLERIFLSFEQASENHRNAKGTGLGLAISSNLVRLMGGTLEVESCVGEGSEFFFVLDLPLAELLDTPVMDNGNPKGNGDGQERSLAGARVLLAEDNDLNAEIVISLLEMQDVEVDRAADGREALDLFGASEVKHYDAVLMDVQMPVLDGLRAAAEIRASGRLDAQTVPIIALTANTFEEDRQSAEAAGMNGFLPKPFDVQQLYNALREFMGTNSQREP